LRLYSVENNINIKIYCYFGKNGRYLLETWRIFQKYVFLKVMKGRDSMRLKKIWVGCLLIISVIVLTFSAGWSATRLETENIQIRCSNNLTVIAQQVAESYMRENPGVIVSVSSMGSMRGVKSLINATCNIAMASSDLDDDLKRISTDDNVTVTKHVIAHDALVPIVNNRNTVTNLTVEQLRELFSGEIKNWQQVGGPNEPVIIVSEDGNSGDYATWQEKVMHEGKVVTPQAHFVATSGAMKEQIAQTPGAIGYVSLAHLDNSTKALTVEGISAKPDTIKSKKYPLMRELIVYTTQNPIASVTKFLDYSLGEEGQQLITQAGVIPMN
jgi:phosphate transport system substrate-binding protein